MVSQLPSGKSCSRITMMERFTLTAFYGVQRGSFCTLHTVTSPLCRACPRAILDEGRHRVFAVWVEFAHDVEALSERIFVRLA